MRPEIESILLANWYLTKCKIDSPQCSKTELARQYLTATIKKALFERKSQEKKSIKQSFFLFS